MKNQYLKASSKVKYKKAEETKSITGYFLMINQ